MTTTSDSNSTVEKPAANPSSSPAGSAATPPLAEASPIAARAKEHHIRVSPDVLDAAAKDGDELLRFLHSGLDGLTQSEAESRARTSGPNEVAQEHRRGGFIRLLIIMG